jgi:predicted transcriptional regulator
MSTKAFNISLPEELVKKLDKIAKRDYTSRSDIIRRAILREVRTSPRWDNIEEVDETIDEPGWKTIADFRPPGVSTETLILALQTLEKKNAKSRKVSK